MSELIERLQELHEKATPGPWESRRNAADCPTVGRVGLDGNIVPRFAKFADAALVAAVRNALPDLLAAAKEAERLKQDLREANEAIRELQQAACDREGVPMPSQRPVVERLREELDHQIKIATTVATELTAEKDRLRNALLNIKAVQRWRDIPIDTVACCEAIQDCREMYDIADAALSRKPASAKAEGGDR